MRNIKQKLQDHHNKNKHYAQLRINFYFEDMEKNSNNTLLAKQDIQVLIKRLTSKGYIREKDLAKDIVDALMKKQSISLFQGDLKENVHYN